MIDTFHFSFRTHVQSLLVWDRYPLRFHLVDYLSFDRKWFLCTRHFQFFI